MDHMKIYEKCSLCPRNCQVNRTKTNGFCLSKNKVKIARAALHYWEEPCISGKKGSGTVFFSGCTLRCCFCQNHHISSGGFGKEITEERLGEIFLELQDKGANNINLVTAVQYVPSVIKALDLVRDKLSIPIVYNSGGYESVETLKKLEDYVDVYLPDLKYYAPFLSKRYSQAEDYFDKASKAIKEMIRQKGAPVFDENGMMKKGVIVRHMVLPGYYQDSIKLLHWMKQELPFKQFMVSILSQYTPYYKSCEYPEINRRLTTYEYEKVLNEAMELGFVDGYMQEKSSAKEEYTPPFDLEGV